MQICLASLDQPENEKKNKKNKSLLQKLNACSCHLPLKQSRRLRSDLKRDRGNGKTNIQDQISSKRAAGGHLVVFL